MITTERRYNLDEYRAIARKAEGRSEYRDGESVGIELAIAEIYRGVVFE